MSRYPNPNNYHNQWHYGYTLGPPSEANNGDYSVHYGGNRLYQQQHHQGYRPQRSSEPPPYSSAISSGRDGFKPPLPMAPRPRPQQNKFSTPSNANKKPFSTPPTMKVLTDPSASALPATGPKSWQEVKSSPSYTKPSKFVTKVFVTASPSSTTNTESSAGDESKANIIGPTMPEEDAMHAKCLSQLHDLAAYNNIVEKYEALDDTGGMYQVTLSLDSETYIGTGTSLKGAKQNAAMQALANTSLTKRVTMKPRPGNVTNTSELYELAQRKGLTVDFKFLEPFNFKFDKNHKNLWSKDEMRGNYKVQLDIGGRSFFGTAEFPQQAKHNAALEALAIVRSMPDLQSEKTALQQKPIIIQASQEVVHKNPIMYLNELGMNHGCAVSWAEIDENGPPHQKIFTWKCKIGDFEAYGAGNSKKAAKVVAAQNLLQALPPEVTAPAPKGAKKRKLDLKGLLTNSKGTDHHPVTLDPMTTASTTSTGPSPAKEIKTEDTVATATPAPPKKVLVHSLIKATNPISALHEYCRKVKVPEPEFECISENVIETWIKAGRNFKKIEYTFRVEIEGQTYFGTANTKKKAKTNVATDAWNVIRATTIPIP